MAGLTEGALCLKSTLCPGYVSPDFLSSYPDLRLYSRDGVFFSLNRAVFAARSKLGVLLVEVTESPATLITDLATKDLADVFRFLITGMVPVDVSTAGFSYLGINPPLLEMVMTMLNDGRDDIWNPECHGRPLTNTDGIFESTPAGAQNTTMGGNLVIDKQRTGPSESNFHSVARNLDERTENGQPKARKAEARHENEEQVSHEFESVDHIKTEITEDEIEIQYFDDLDEDEDLEPRTHPSSGSNSPSCSINFTISSDSDDEFCAEDCNWYDINNDIGGDRKIGERSAPPPLCQPEFFLAEDRGDRDLCRKFKISSTLQVRLERLKRVKRKKHKSRPRKKKRVNLKNLTHRILEEAKARTVRECNAGIVSSSLLSRI